ARHESVSDERQAARERLLQPLRRTPTAPAMSAYNETISASLRIAGPRFMSVFRIQDEAASLRQRYGGEFGQRCLLARRLVESGVRFVEVSHNLNFLNGTGWDTH